ncbi:MAG: ribose-phosphate diphosphokinase [Colwellia sp.]|nr:ribose-phosphate diphosphokinase [Colwellia sp.]MCW8863925.1 ribose-phosphate diphosphokinase [Colwellia sp.]MCW9081207.1 ribose-phosphate diphosphokinase [Colwellia sp.]
MTLVLGFNDYLAPAQQLAQALAMPFKQVESHQFPDGETKVTLPSVLSKQLILCQTLNQPDHKLIELILVAQTAREQGVEHITLVAPYLCYMRQDIAFHAGEAVSQRIIGKLLSDYFDAVLTIDPHLHRIHHLSQAIPNCQTLTLHATPAMSAFIRQHVENPVIIGPDEESMQWVKAIVRADQWHYTIASKQRFGDKDVAVTLEDINLAKRDVIIVDDIASTGRTLEQTVKQLVKQEPNSISIMVTHAFFVDDAIERLNTLGVNNIWSSDSVLHNTNAFSVIEILAQAIKSSPQLSR